MKKEIPENVLRQWGLEDAELLDVPVNEGSPARVNFRQALRASNGDTYILECLPPEKLTSRLAQARFLLTLQVNDFKQVPAWLPTLDGNLGFAFGNAFWQLRAWVPGAPLPREEYAADEWRGTACAELLVALKEKSAHLPVTDVFTIPHYISHLMRHIRSHNPALYNDLQPILETLAPFLQTERDLPVHFCHGDFHPLNIIWGDHKINALIDWEFCGFKTEAYDVANLLGCIGMDAPENLTCGMALQFVKTLRQWDFLSDKAWRWLPETIAAQRFAWMREWCFATVRDMMVQELDFIWLLLDNADLLRSKWS